MVLVSRMARDEGRVDPDVACQAGAARGADGLVAAGQDLGEEPLVVLDELLLLLGNVTVLRDRLDRADGLTGAAVDALLAVDVELALSDVDAVHGALLDARLVGD